MSENENRSGDQPILGPNTAAIISERQSKQPIQQVVPSEQINEYQLNNGHAKQVVKQRSQQVSSQDVQSR